MRKYPSFCTKAAVVVLLAGVLAALSGCTRPGQSGGGQDAFGPGPTQVAPGNPSQPPAPVDTTPLLQPQKKYFGVAVAGAPASMDPVKAYTAMVGKQPNIIENYASWGDKFDSSGIRQSWQNGSLPYIAWEPYKTKFADIASGSDDSYIKTFATAAQKVNVPVAISFAHEMNGFWYDWGTKANSAADFVAAWKHIHDIFQDRGASNVIWVWSPNIINPVGGVALQPYYPGDGYVDWVGVIGYWTECCDKSFDQVYGPTMTQIRSFTAKPFLISETAAEPGKHAASFVNQLFAGVARRPDVIGFVWFNIVKRADWRLESYPPMLDAFKTNAADAAFGFDPRNPK